jgi:uncharacterized DUF497 family protein
MEDSMKKEKEMDRKYISIEKATKVQCQCCKSMSPSQIVTNFAEMFWAAGVNKRVKVMVVTYRARL